jgi:Ni,Fe-hydrogenase III large subunit
VDSTGILRKKTAMDLGVTGMPARASGINLDLRSFDPLYLKAGFKPRVQEKGDVLARLLIRLDEFADSLQLIRAFAKEIVSAETGEHPQQNPEIPGADVCRDPAQQTPSASRSALGAAESWRGPVLFWVELDGREGISRCKITDPSFKNWQALSFAVLDNIIPDFPVCNKSFDLSYSGNDL